MPGSYAICPICFWEDDAAQLADPVNGGGANRVSLVEAQANYWAHGTSEPRLAQFVRQPTGDDVREFGWRPIDPRLDDFSREKAKPWPDDPTVLYWWRPTSRVGRDA
ncbi:hypothetical protein AX769_16605 [Frondihabitans sp. PAMC 28766]|nr:hypothetical protein AX769_16605 [Frondihabitans sp. PAMC 28766]